MKKIKIVGPKRTHPSTFPMSLIGVEFNVHDSDCFPNGDVYLEVNGIAHMFYAGEYEDLSLPEAQQNAKESTVAWESDGVRRKWSIHLTTDANHLIIRCDRPSRRFTATYDKTAGKIVWRDSRGLFTQYPKVPYYVRTEVNKLLTGTTRNPIPSRPLKMMKEVIRVFTSGDVALMATIFAVSGKLYVLERITAIQYTDKGVWITGVGVEYHGSGVGVEVTQDGKGETA